MLVLAALIAATSLLPPERIQSNPNQTPAGTLKNGILTLELEVRRGTWHLEAENGPALEVFAFAERGKPLQIPGPLVRVRRGTRIKLSVHNPLETTLVLHGMNTRPSRADDTVHVAAGATHYLTFDAGASGTYFYWASTSDSDLGSRTADESQLSGAFIVDEQGAVVDDRVFVIGMYVQPQDAARNLPPREAMTINGNAWPHTERLLYQQFDSIHWRLINASESTHPMHLHGFYFQVRGLGDWTRAEQFYSARRFLAVTQLLPVGGTADLTWVPEKPGNWIFHCHFAFHVSHHLVLDPVAAKPAGHGMNPMSGLVLGMHVKPAPTYKASSFTARRQLRINVETAQPNSFGDLPSLRYRVAGIESEHSPTLVLKRNEPVAITIVNRLQQSTTIHWHGIELESYPDGVPDWSGDHERVMRPIMPGDSFVAEFTPPRAGTFIYHAHVNEGLQINSGLYGALIVVDDGHPFNPDVDRVVIVGAAGPDSLPSVPPAMVNGSRTPEPLTLRAGRAHRLRLININADWRVSFNLLTDSNVLQWRPIAKDGADLPAALRAPVPARLVTGPGETADFEIVAPASTPPGFRIEVKTVLSGWYIPIALKVIP